ncbi:MAG: SDR family oxidoreductase [Solirubrobacterales bacterium]
MTKDTVLILGATSDIGRAVARAYAAEGHAIALAARSPAAVAVDAEDLRIRHGVPVSVHPFDVLDPSALPDLWPRLDPPPRIVVCVVGMLGDHARSVTSPEAAELVLRTNFNAPALALEQAAARLEGIGGGVIVGVSSVAGDRGRAANYVYGAAKAGLTAYLSGLRARLRDRGVRVITVKPGFVRTRMTAGMRLPPLLTADPDEVAAAILSADRHRRDVVYVRPIWRPIMAVIRALPEPLFKRLKL